VRATVVGGHGGGDLEATFAIGAGNSQRLVARGSLEAFEGAVVAAVLNAEVPVDLVTGPDQLEFGARLEAFAAVADVLSHDRGGGLRCDATYEASWKLLGEREGG
jgi:hypothetical protein